MTKLLKNANLEFHHLIDCQAYVYLWKNHPLAKEASIRFEQLEKYPCLSFEQGDNSSFYLAEEILSTNEYPQVIKANDQSDHAESHDWLKWLYSLLRHHL